MYTHTQLYVIFLIAALWSLAWGIIGFLITDGRLNKPHLGLILGILFGPFVLLLLTLGKTNAK